MNTFIMLVRPVEPQGQWMTSTQAINARENMAMRQYITDNAPVGSGGSNNNQDVYSPAYSPINS